MRGMAAAFLLAFVLVLSALGSVWIEKRCIDDENSKGEDEVERRRRG